MTQVGDGINHDRGEWKFDAEVAKTFDDHISKSVMVYGETRRLCIELSDWFVHDDCWIYDLGCSTGSLIKALRERHQRKQIRYVGVDNSEPMLSQAREIVGDTADVKFINEDFEKLSIDHRTTLLYSLYSMQFVPPQRRQEVMQRLWSGMSAKSALIMVEKVIDDSPIIADMYGHIHWARKVEAGFKVDEIYAKAQSLRGVMSPFTESQNIQMLREVGFKQVSTFVKGGNFAGFLAIK